MSAEELALLPRMVANANLYILNWDLMAYYEDPDADVDEYLVYLDHQLQLHGVHRSAPARARTHRRGGMTA